MQFNIFQHLRAISTSIRGGSSSVSMSGQGYVPRGSQTNTSAGSGKPGGPPGKPKPSGTGKGGRAA
ncbi:hypothetical protein ARMSODRAFT_1024532 [Armillaria solidipes]|uniref:Uncharacterized protein n=1 Tax=Armillaria solidipes TaxID=1076256 RepID=A0A2H3AXP1_9AGAR|nr:hypothetical protein ARMSODRAFT_1025033 [Armillaria solidipes]PBK62756.1 hypothetical protein ARMSODRAFT_1024532 [Armillaria solidipes]